MDKLTFCNNYLYSCGQVIFIFVDKLSLLWCLFCLRRYVCWLCMFVEMEAMRDRVDLWMRTDSKETMINKPSSHLFTDVVLPLHSSEEWGPCVVRGPVDGRFLVWWVIDNAMWTDSWLSIAGAGSGLTSIGASEEQVWKVVAGEASRCGQDK
jgi:hypothetical protein